jgi:hypothetical protein
MPADDYTTLQRRKLTAAMRAQRRLERRLDDLEWERDVLAPALAELERKIAAGEKVEITSGV